MTGRDLILYILKNELENEEIFDENGSFKLGMGVKDAAVALEVGEETVKAWYKLGYLEGVKINDDLYIFPDVPVLKEVVTLKQENENE